MPKQLKVAQTLSKDTVVINAGRDDNIKIGLQFVIYEEGPEIQDPETNLSLGRLEIVKGQVQAIDVQDKLTVAKAVKRTVTRTRTIPNLYGVLAKGLQHETYEIDIADRMKVDVQTPDYEDRLTVRVGDLVRRIEG